MAKAKDEIERKMIPKGPNVIRHLILPADGQSLEWIGKEMDNMDSEVEGANWRLGKLSGAVYREHISVDVRNMFPISPFRRWRRLGEGH